MKFEKEPLGYELKGFSISKIFDTNFLGALGKEGVELSINHVTIEFKGTVENKASSYVTIGYLSKKGKEEGKVSVTASDPASLNHVLKALEKVD